MSHPFPDRLVSGEGLCLVAGCTVGIGAACVVLFGSQVQLGELRFPASRLNVMHPLPSGFETLLLRYAGLGGLVIGSLPYIARLMSHFKVAEFLQGQVATRVGLSAGGFGFGVLVLALVEKLNRDKITPNWRNIAIIGTVESGKTSLVNRLCDRPHTNPLHTTKEYYRSVDHSGTIYRIWDFPGVTLMDDQNSFYSKYSLAQFDCIVVVSATRTREIEIGLVHQAVRRNLKVLFVRNKVDLDVESRKQRMGDTKENAFESVRDTIEQDARPQLKDVGAAECEILLVSSRIWNGYDEKKLRDRIFIK